MLWRNLLHNEDFQGDNTILQVEEVNVALNQKYECSIKSHYVDEDMEYQLVLIPNFMRNHNTEQFEEEHALEVTLSLYAERGQIKINQSKSRIKYLGYLEDDFDEGFLYIENYEILARIVEK